MMLRRAGHVLASCLSLLPTFGLAAAGYIWASAMWSDWRLSDRIVTAGQSILEGRRPSGTQLFESIATSRIEEQGLVCAADMRRALAIVEIGRLEESRGAAQGQSDAQPIAEIVKDVRRSLVCTPTDGFLWFVMGWLTQASRGSEAASWAYFKESYAKAPYESWVVLRRSAFLTAQLDRLPKDLARSVLDEFRDIVSNGFYREAFAILTGPGWSFRDELLQSLAGSAPIRRANFARMLRNAEIYTPIPGVPQEADRPWKR